MKICGACVRELPDGSYSEEQSRLRQSIRRCEECVAAGNQLVLMKKGHTRSEADDCPICQLPLPLDVHQSMSKMCCMKRVCNGCILAAVKRGMRDCPFCRAPTPDASKALAMIRKRVAAGDPVAIWFLGSQYFLGTYGLKKDTTRAVELYERAAELGVNEAHHNLGTLYAIGADVEKDMAKAFRHYEAAAMGGDVHARHNLGCIEGEAGNCDLGLQHILISAKLGNEDSLNTVKKMFMNGHATKADYAAALRGYQNAIEEMSSPDRDEAKALGFMKIKEMVRAAEVAKHLLRADVEAAIDASLSERQALHARRQPGTVHAERPLPNAKVDEVLLRPHDVPPLRERFRLGLELLVRHAARPEGVHPDDRGSASHLDGILAPPRGYGVVRLSQYELPRLAILEIASVVQPDGTSADAVGPHGVRDGPVRGPPGGVRAVRRYAVLSRELAGRERPLGAHRVPLLLPDLGVPLRPHEGVPSEQLVGAVARHGVLEPELRRPLENRGYHEAVPQDHAVVDLQQLDDFGEVHVHELVGGQPDHVMRQAVLGRARRREAEVGGLVRRDDGEGPSELDPELAGRRHDGARVDAAAEDDAALLDRRGIGRAARLGGDVGQGRLEDGAKRLGLAAREENRRGHDIESKCVF
ncbi:hypothetical protein THAOC_17026 [Thalassiosira oceanica]|uniref:RING-type domain-containing protein n=1 Tax=Thalassiosira oceanica TaxID=159749 RepID=K0SN43_THAOC|nr:hypothetical protein THAOC_17026 [Thalassiosira oceanica]|eukprot:EJK62366.1 hypothetical protein THAOC_17026 [Thalassiosira oceanica]